MPIRSFSFILVLLIISSLVLITPSYSAQNDGKDILELADLVVAGIEFIDPHENNLVKGEAKISVLYLNQGNSTITDDWTIKVILEKKTKEIIVNKTISPNDMQYCNFSLELWTGYLKLNVSLDANNDINESLEGNNYWNRTITVKKLHIDYFCWDCWGVMLIIIPIFLIIYWFLLKKKILKY